ncbi:MAG: hypothetical protein AMR96_01745 [Candidatus Adiutrix intracellularis]|nr:MAG: hypothetical protein AMR96_01745 [Candidatus Adiutrix intracellularis]
MLSPYDRNKSPEINLTLAVIISIGLHILLGWFFFFVMPHYANHLKIDPHNIITVQLLGSVAPPAPAAPKAMVDPNLKGPDVIDAPKSTPVPPPTPPRVPIPKALATAPTEVIPLGPKSSEKPLAIKKIETPPPKPIPLQVEPEKPKPKPASPKFNPDAELNKRMEALKRKVEREQTDDDVDSRLYNRNITQGQGQDEGSESGGASPGERIDPLKAAYYQHLKDIVSSNWLPPSGSLAAGLQAIFAIRVEPNGQLSGMRLEKSSGTPDYDMSVERAIRKSSPFPPLPPVFNNTSEIAGLKFGLSEMQH